MNHTIRVEAELQEITAFGDSRRRSIATGYDVTCSCGYTGHYYTADDANAAANAHLDEFAQGKVMEPPRAPVDPMLSHRVAVNDLERQKERMLETGDIFADC